MNHDHSQFVNAHYPALKALAEHLINETDLDGSIKKRLREVWLDTKD